MLPRKDGIIVVAGRGRVAIFADVEAVQKQLMDELTRLQKEYPLAMLLGTFALGVVVGRALK